MSLAVVLAMIGFGLLFAADYSLATATIREPRPRMAWVLEHGDHLHYAVHLTLGRLFDVCPCTRRAAATQYYKGRFHALTPRQRDAVTHTHPRSAGEWVAYALDPIGVSLDWAGDALHWVRGDRPALAITIDLNGYEVAPEEVHVVRGATVVWRNVDEWGEPHTVSTDPRLPVVFDSAPLEPDESFSFTFTERGRFAYYCRFHGAPGHQGMAGVIDVE